MKKLLVAAFAFAFVQSAHADLLVAFDFADTPDPNFREPPPLFRPALMALY